MSPPARTILHLAEARSTSDLARERIAAGAAPPLVVWADRQTAGRGRAARSWWSDAGSLTFTAALDPAAVGLRPDHAPRVALAAALALIEALDLPAGIRWPNDVEVGGKKIAGLLPEQVASPRGPVLLVGIGLNVTTDLRAAPAEVRRMATSLAEVWPAARGPVPAPSAWLDAILNHLDASLARLARDDASLVAEWNRLDTLSGCPVRVDLGSRVVEGIGAGIDARGGLKVVGPDGFETLYGGQVLREVP